MTEVFYGLCNELEKCIETKEIAHEVIRNIISAVANRNNPSLEKSVLAIESNGPLYYLMLKSGLIGSSKRISSLKYGGHPVLVSLTEKAENYHKQLFYDGYFGFDKQ